PPTTDRAPLPLHDALPIYDADMATAVNRLTALGGGQVAVADGAVLAEVPCPIGGLLSDLPAEKVAAQVHRMHDASRELGVTLPRSEEHRLNSSHVAISYAV